MRCPGPFHFVLTVLIITMAFVLFLTQMLVFLSVCVMLNMYMFVLVICLEAVVLSQVRVTLSIFYQHIVHGYRQTDRHRYFIRPVK